MRRGTLWVMGLAAACAAAGVPATAQDWPAHDLTLVVPFAAGGDDDILARMLAPRLAQFLGQPVNVENVPGSGGMVGAARVAKAAPDGYELLLGTSATHALSQTLHKKPPYNAITDFTPVALLAEQPFVVVARKNLPVSRLDELVAYAKAHPRTVQFASAGEGSSTHLVCTMFNAAAGIQANHVAYTGAVAAMRDVVAERIDYYCPALSLAIAPISRQDVKAIAILARNRAQVLPELASAHEQGLADFSAWTWFAVFLPRGVPDPIAAKMHEAALAAIGQPFVQARLKQIGADVVAPDRRSQAYLQKFVEAEIAKWASDLKIARLQPY
ncbi:MAG TPA: tripartite tricarboxylate transporter substrate binding protein [Burkholderiales bacterium]